MVSHTVQPNGLTNIVYGCIYQAVIDGLKVELDFYPTQRIKYNRYSDILNSLFAMDVMSNRLLFEMKISDKGDICIIGNHERKWDIVLTSSIQDNNCIEKLVTFLADYINKCVDG